MSRKGTVSDYAYWRGCSTGTVYNAIKAGRVPIGPDRIIDFDAADKQWEGSWENAGRGGDRRSAKYRAQKAGEADPNEPDGPQEQISLVDARIRNEILKARTQELKLAELEGKLIRRDIVQKVEFALGKGYRDVVEQRAVHIAPLVAGKTDLLEIETIIRTEIRAALQEAADRAEQHDFVGDLMDEFGAEEAEEDDADADDS